MAIGAMLGLAAFKMIGGGLMNASRQKTLNQKNRARARQLAENVNQLEGLVSDQKMSIDEAMTKYNEMINNETGEMKTLLIGQAERAEEKVTLQYNQTLENMDRQLEKRMADATEREKRVLEEIRNNVRTVKDQTEEMRKDQLKKKIQLGFEDTGVGRKLAEQMGNRIEELQQQGIDFQEAQEKALNELQEEALFQKGQLSDRYQQSVKEIGASTQDKLTQLMLGAQRQKTQYEIGAEAQKRALDTSATQNIMKLQNMQTELTAFQPTFGQSFMEGAAGGLGMGLGVLGAEFGGAVGEGFGEYGGEKSGYEELTNKIVRY